VTGPIVVAVDNSPHARGALEWALAYAGRVDVGVVAVHALGLVERMASGEFVPAQRHRDEITTRFETLVAGAAGAADVRATTRVRDGEAVGVVRGVAREEDASLIVVGTRGEHPGIAAMGSTSARLAGESTVPVVVVPLAQ
jgi:nucleotide-binding universal stress UspA family protein